MKRIFLCSITLFLTSCLSSCMEKDHLYEGMYDSMNTMHEMNTTDELDLPTEKDTPTYQQYKREREEIRAAETPTR